MCCTRVERERERDPRAVQVFLSLKPVQRAHALSLSLSLARPILFSLASEACHGIRMKDCSSPSSSEARRSPPAGNAAPVCSVSFLDSRLLMHGPKKLHKCLQFVCIASPFLTRWPAMTRGPADQGPGQRASRVSLGQAAWPASIQPTRCRNCQCADPRSYTSAICLQPARCPSSLQPTLGLSLQPA